jgi:NADP-dependent 3-hydroxy acid dehydrogenase YdfG
VWVIGASTGIGAATAARLLAAGARVALSARKADKLAAVAGASAAGARALILPLDFTDSAQVAAAWDRVRTEWGGCDLVLIVAGTHHEVRAWELNEADARALFEVNLHAVVNTTAAVVPRCSHRDAARSASSRRSRVTVDCRRR